MIAPHPSPSLADRLFRLALMFAFALLLAKAIAGWPTVWDSFVAGDNDDMMRLMSVRDWLNGQDWYDMTQYRVLPPEGISLHWSRFVDLGIATVLVPLSWILPQPVAEQLTLVIWPSLLLASLLALTALVTRKVLGTAAAGLSVLSLVLWPAISDLNFTLGRIDHHGVQILMMALIAAALVWPGGPFRRGLVAGLAAAFSLAVGLEALVFILTAGAILTWHAAFSRPGADRILLGFCLALIAGSVAFFVGQTSPSRWLLASCDALGPPILALTVIGGGAALLPLAGGARLRPPVRRLMASATLAILGLGLGADLLLPCLVGPYGTLPAELQAAISTRITEARPGVLFASLNPFGYLLMMGALCGAVLLATGIWLQDQKHGDAVRNAAVGQMLCFGWLGLLGSFFQIRLIILAAPAVPFLTGYVLAQLLERWRLRRTGASALMVGAALAVTLCAPLLTGQARSLIALARGTDIPAPQVPLDRECLTPEILRQLTTLPRARLFTTLNLGAPLILLTQHDALTAPYHRSAVALGNGMLAFADETKMLAALRKSGAEYLLLCRANRYGPDHAFARDLLEGASVSWLHPVALETPDLALFRVQADAMDPAL